jgi:outer membrane lipoprotein LolB
VDAHGSQGARSVNADFDLQGNAEQGELQLATPMGTVLAQARWRPGEVLLKQNNGERRFANLTALADEVLGEPLPLGALLDWVRGRPWSGAPSATRGNGFEQLGWTIDLAQWPQGLVVARRAAPPVVTVKAKLAS